MIASTNNTNVLDRLIQRAQRLYTLPSVALRVLELTDTPRVDMHALKACLENDPALTSRILKVVNSSLFGLTRRVGDLGQALALMGSKPLKLLVLGFSLPKNLLSDVEMSILNFYWGHAIVKAIAAREIMERMFTLPGDEAFLAGLLHDLGMLVLAQDLGEPYCQFLDQVVQNGADLPAMELETLGFDHRVLSARLLESWSLPESIVRAVGVPDDEEQIAQLSEPTRALAKVLRMADLLARFVQQSRIGLLPKLMHLGEAYCGLTTDKLNDLVATLDAKVPELSEILSVQIQPSREFSRILAEAHERLAGLAVETATGMLGGEVRHPTCFTIPREFDLNEAAARLVPPSADSSQASATSTMDIWLGKGSGEPVSRKVSVGSKTGSPSARRGLRSEIRIETDMLGLTARVEAAIAECRRKRCPISLLFAEADPHAALLLRHGPESTARMVDMLGQVLEALADGVATPCQVDEARFAFILEAYDRVTSVEFARHLVERVRGWSHSIVDKLGMPLTISVGVATLSLPPKNFPTADLIQAAERCLSGVMLSSGDSYKSINIY